MMNIKVIIFLLVFVLIDIYVLLGLKQVFAKSLYHNIFRIGYGLLAIIAYIGLYTLINYFKDRGLNASLGQNLLIGFAFSFFIFKVIVSLFFVADDVIRLAQYIYQYAVKAISSTPKEVSFRGRRKFIVQTGLLIASIPFSSMLYGITKGKYNYKVKKVALKFANLPKAFHGFKIVQISDIHSGSFDSKEDVRRGVDVVNMQNADAIFFTGDLVNNDSREIDPFIDIFKKLKSKYGIFSVLGNHDYGDYKRWDSKEAKKANMDLLFEQHKKMGFDLLNNENRKIRIGNDSISVLGVENWGKPPFPQRGDLNRSLEGVPKDSFKILMSHDPSHWDLEVLKHQTHIDLTLSGHTHGMQFGVEIPGIKWSPSKYIYPRWAGLYEEAKQYLYVNRGFGFLGFPGRVGIWPEITVIELITDC